MNQLQIRLSEFDAVIFDMDGTMVKNMSAHKRAWQEFLALHDVDLSDDDFKEKIHGKKNDQILKLVLGRAPSPEESRKLADEKEALYRKLYEPDITEVPGLTSLIKKLQVTNVKLAIATTAPEKNRDFVLESLNLQGEFELIIGDEHVTHGKPHPEIYLKTAEELGLDARRCLVFEDSPPGVLSAKAAGMKVVAVLTSHTQQELADSDYCVTDFTEVDLV